MMTTAEAQSRIATSERRRNLDAMERLVLAFGNRTHYMQWLACFPEDVTLDSGGGVSNSDMTDMAADEAAYNATVQGFAALMLPVLDTLAG